MLLQLLNFLLFLCCLPSQNELIDRIFKTPFFESGDFFLGGVFGPFFAIWSISSHVGVQIGLKLVRLIALIGLNKFWTNVTSPKSLQKFHTGYFENPSSEYVHFWYVNS